MSEIISTDKHEHHALGFVLFWICSLWDLFSLGFVLFGICSLWDLFSFGFLSLLDLFSFGFVLFELCSLLDLFSLRFVHETSPAANQHFAALKPDSVVEHTGFAALRRGRTITPKCHCDNLRKTTDRATSCDYGALREGARGWWALMGCHCALCIQLINHSDTGGKTTKSSHRALELAIISGPFLVIGPSIN
jgi:hypothetical protein